ncbi:MAG: hypothetical protein IKA48_01975 [Fibrobacter sp.]|nr:hypothetical protein [Fibrobacter sp.]
MAEYVHKINGKQIAASAVVPNSALDQRITNIEEFTNLGAFEIVLLTTGVDPHPDVLKPSNKVIYLTKDASLQIDDPYTEWIYILGDPTDDPPTSDRWEIIGTTAIKFQRATTTEEGITILNSETVDKTTGELSDDETMAVTAKGVKEAVETAAGKPDQFTTGNIPAFDANGDLVDTGLVAANSVQGVVDTVGTNFVNDTTHIATIPTALPGNNSAEGNLGLVTIATIEL